MSAKNRAILPEGWKKQVKQPRVSVIILNWNGLDNTLECLDSVKRIAYPNFETIVFDNGSDNHDEKAIIQARFSGFAHVMGGEKNVGYSGFNVAIDYTLKNSSPDYILLLDNDTVVDRNCLDELVKVMTTDSQIGAVAAVIYCYDEPDEIQQSLSSRVNFWIGDVIGMDWVTKLLKIRPTLKDNLPKEMKQTGFWCILIKRECFEKVGLIDRSYFFTWEGIDYCEKLRREGYKIVYAPKAKVWHKWRTAFGVDGRTEYYHPRNRFKFMRRYGTRLQNISFFLFFFGIHFWLAIVYYLVWHRRPDVSRSFIRGALDGVLGRYK
jgi:hypothetical protein